jgi:hypothetical protein
LALGFAVTAYSRTPAPPFGKVGSFVGSVFAMADNKTFEGARLKVKRANRYIEELNAVMQAFVNTEFCKVSIDAQNPKCLRVDPVKSLPTDIPLIIGDAVHNIAGALDHMVYAICPDEDMQFPRSRKRDNVETSREYGLVKQASPEIANFILNEIQPYPGGKLNVWDIIRLNNIDKHRLLIPLLATTGLVDLVIEDENYNTTSYDFLAIIASRTDFVSGAFPYEIKSYSYRHATAGIFFPPGSPFEKQSVAKTLVEVRDTITGILNSLEPLWFGKSKEG